MGGCANTEHSIADANSRQGEQSHDRVKAYLGHYPGLGKHPWDELVIFNIMPCLLRDCLLLALERPVWLPN